MNSPSGDDEQVALFNMNPDPFGIRVICSTASEDIARKLRPRPSLPKWIEHVLSGLTANVKEPTPIQDVPNLLVLVQVFLEERFELGLVGFS